MVTNSAGGNKRTLAVLKKSENDGGETKPRGQSQNSNESNSLVEIHFSKSIFKEKKKKIIVSGDSSDIKQSYKNFCQDDKHDKAPFVPKSEGSGSNEGARSSNCKGEKWQFQEKNLINRNLLRTHIISKDLKITPKYLFWGPKVKTFFLMNLNNVRIIIILAPYFNDLFSNFTCLNKEF